SPRTITAPLRCAAFRIRTAAAATSISTAAAPGLPGLLCAAGFACDGLLGTSGAGFPQPQTTSASTRQARETNCFLKVEFAVIQSEVISAKTSAQNTCAACLAKVATRFPDPSNPYSSGKAIPPRRHGGTEKKAEKARLFWRLREMTLHSFDNPAPEARKK